LTINGNSHGNALRRCHYVLLWQRLTLPKKEIYYISFLDNVSRCHSNIDDGVAFP